MDGSGQIDSYELQRAVHSLGFFLPESEWQVQRFEVLATDLCEERM